MANSVADLHSLFSTMEGSDHNDSACIDFNSIRKIRYKDRVSDPTLYSPGILQGLRVGVLDEFAIEELDPRNRRIQALAIEML